MGSTVALIPLRGGSKGVPDKNIRELAGAPLCSYAIKEACKCKKIKQVYVSTDSKKIAKISKEYGAKCLERPKWLGRDETTTEAVMMNFVWNVEFTTIVLIQATNPFITASALDVALKEFEMEEYDSMLSVCSTDRRFFWGKANGGSYLPMNYSLHNRPRRQDEYTPIYMENGSFYITNRDRFVDSTTRVSGRVGVYTMPPHTRLEIDTETDFIEAEIVMKRIQSDNKV